VAAFQTLTFVVRADGSPGKQELVGEVARVTEERDAARADVAALRQELHERRQDDEEWQATGAGASRATP
jgi:hypothetical protein